ncbi:hypothetical protein ACI6QG_14110 [Roseococcus sp. DSY-14]|uniref:hypothetical protein n=1 Tax=Roseococcus sp. DSY-14 TaxID=3369650 RepID=UPI00387B48B7
MTAGGAPGLHGWTPATFLGKLAHLRKGDRGRAPHKPLLLLLLLGDFVRRGRTSIPFREARDRLDPLLPRHGATGMAPSAADPFIYLASEGLWAIAGGEGWTPAKLDLLNPQGGFTPEVTALLHGHPGLAAEAVATLLRQHFPVAQHDALRTDLALP